MDDLITRQAVKDWLNRWLGYLDEDMIARMQIGTKDIPPVELFGYSVEELLTFAQVCRMQGITEENLKDFCLNFSAATDAAFQMTLQKISDDMGKEIVKCIERTLT